MKEKSVIIESGDLFVTLSTNRRFDFILHVGESKIHYLNFGKGTARIDWSSTQHYHDLVYIRARKEIDET